jgi:hypothetical protein
LALAILLVPTATAAQQPAGVAQVPESLRREIMVIEERIGQANFACDYAYFGEIEAPEFIFTDPAGGVTTRAEDLAGQGACRPRKGTYRLRDVRLAVYGEVVVFNALATTRTTSPDGKPVERTQRFTDVLVRRGGRWRLAAGHSSRVQ